MCSSGRHVSLLLWQETSFPGSLAVSGRVIERSPDEERLEEHILKALRRELSARPDAEQILAVVQAFWSAQDAPAKQLDAHQFHTVMHRGKQAL
ncbi:MAG: hypothetical protein J2P36_04280 [Ktedonobacteraceae bacterium]|nr:hypothetical protein [Ktedonobacteraceae bacterium]